VAKALLISVVFAAVFIPALAARTVNPLLGLRRAVAGVLAFNVVYYFLIRFVFPRL